MIEALHYNTLQDDHVKCTLCPHFCKLSPGKVGICGVRQNINGRLFSLVYEKAVATHVDPIEKKPLFHVYPGSKSFSIATSGCNFHCEFCQNCDISQVSRKSSQRIMGGQSITADDIVAIAEQHNCKTIACTYTEPTVFFEYAYDIARQAHESEIGTLFISNGYITEEPLRQMAPFLMGANIDLKAWDEDFYRRIVGGEMKHVLQTLKLLKKLDVWVEVTTLLVPTYCDDDESLTDIATFIYNELGKDTPWHISRFYPQYKIQDLPRTPIDVLNRAREIGLSTGLRYVYSGNVPGDDGESTYCYKCGTLLLERYGFQILHNKLQDSRCPTCNAEIDGVGLAADA